jgi:hypothetical protein
MDVCFHPEEHDHPAILVLADVVITDAPPLSLPTQEEEKA